MFLRTLSRFASRRVLSAAFLAAFLLAPAVLAQRPFEAFDPFYQEESARRGFYDGFAVSGEVAYRSRGLFTPESDADRPGPLALALRMDYALFRQLDVSAIFDVSGGLVSQLGGGPVRLSWIVLKPYWRNEDTDYAVRIAVDPASEGGLGFRQTDIAFVSTSDLSPLLSSDFAIGLRRARIGYERLRLDEDPGQILLGVDHEPDLVLTRAIGKEVHVMWGHNLHFDPAGSNVSITFLGEAMEYNLVETRPFEAAGSEEDAQEETEERSRFRGGVAWLRAGVEWTRPSYVITPFVNVPMVTWLDSAEQSGTYGPRLRHVKAGLRLTLR